MDPEANAVICGPFVLRMAGFPFDLIRLQEHVGLRELAAVRDARYTALEGLQRKADEPQVLDRARTKEDGRALRAMRSGNYSRLRSCEMSKDIRNIAHELLAAEKETRLSDETFKQAYDEAMSDSRVRVVQTFQRNSALRDGLFAINPESFADWKRWLSQIDGKTSEWTAKDREKIDPLTLYLQRFCAKNDTTGRGGPFAIGDFDLSGVGVVAREVPQEHRAYMARWAADRILDELLEEPGSIACAVPRRAPGVWFANETVVECLSFNYSKHADNFRDAVGEHVVHANLSVQELQVLSACNGSRGTTEIQAAVKSVRSSGSISLDEVEGILRKLEKRGLVILGPEIPYGLPTPFPILQQVASQCGRADVDEALASFEYGLSRFRDAEVEERAQILKEIRFRIEAMGKGNRSASTGKQFYRDHVPIFEESEGRVADLRLGRETVEFIQGHASLISDAYLFLPRNILHMERDVMADWFHGRFLGRSVPLGRYLLAFAEDQGILEERFVEIEAAAKCLHDEMVVAACKDAALRLPYQQGKSFLIDLISKRGVPLPAVCGVDLMLCAEPATQGLEVPSGAAVGEVHADEEGLSHSIFGPYIARSFPDFTSQIAALYRQLVEPGEILMDASLHHRNKSFIRADLPFPEIEAFDRSSQSTNMRRHIEDFDVVLDSGQLRLRERNTDTLVRLVALPFAWLGLPRNPMRVFGFPQRQVGRLFTAQPGQHIPRVSYGQMILSRATWNIESREIKSSSSLAGFSQVQRLRSRLGLPRHVFVSSPREGKPVYVDLDSPLLVRQLSRFGRRCPCMTISEMFPDPEHLWLRTGEKAYTSEIRFSLFDTSTRPGQPAVILKKAGKQHV